MCHGEPRARAGVLRYWITVNNRVLAVVLALLMVAFVVLNFTVEGAGTIFLLLAVGAGLGAAYYFRRSE